MTEPMNTISAREAAEVVGRAVNTVRGWAQRGIVTSVHGAKWGGIELRLDPVEILGVARRINAAVPVHTDGVCYIPVTDGIGRLSRYTVVDPEDADLGAELWHEHATGYVMSTSRGALHLIVSERFNGAKSAGTVVDHADRDKMNNRRSNLRVVTIKQNTQNRGASRHSRTRIRGVKVQQGRLLVQAQGGGRRYSRAVPLENPSYAAALASALRFKLGYLGADIELATFTQDVKDRAMAEAHEVICRPKRHRVS